MYGQLINTAKIQPQDDPFFLSLYVIIITKITFGHES